MAIRLLENHPLTKKLRELEKYMRENNLRLDWNGYQMIFHDDNTNKEAIIKDADSSEPCYDFPSAFETKLVKYDE